MKLLKVSHSKRAEMVEKFLNRFNFHNLKMKGEVDSADEAASKEYLSILKRIIERGRYKSERLFDVDETGLFYWKRMHVHFNNRKICA